VHPSFRRYGGELEQKDKGKSGPKMKKAFTLVEVLIVVAILGILAAIVLPEFQSHTQQAKEAAAKDTLRILRSAIEVYTTEHNGVPPGYVNGQVGSGVLTFQKQMICTTDINGNVSGNTVQSKEFPFGPYLKKVPINPFAGDRRPVVILDDDEPFPEEATGELSWIYKPATKKIRLNWPGTDSEDVRYFDY